MSERYPTFGGSALTESEHTVGSDRTERKEKRATYPLVWILLRLVVAVLLIVLPGPATRLAVVPIHATLMIVRLAVVVLALS